MTAKMWLVYLESGDYSSWSFVPIAVYLSEELARDRASKMNEALAGWNAELRRLGLEDGGWGAKTKAHFAVLPPGMPDEARGSDASFEVQEIECGDLDAIGAEAVEVSDG